MEHRPKCKTHNWRHTSFYYASHILSPPPPFFSYKLKVCDNAASPMLLGTIFSMAFGYFMSLSHFGNSHTSNFPTVIIFVTVIFDQWSVMLPLELFWGTMIEGSEFNQQMLSVLWLFHWPAVPQSLSLFRPPYSLRRNNIEIMAINNLTMVYKFSTKRETHMSLAFNQKLEAMKLSEEGLSKAKTAKS